MGQSFFRGGVLRTASVTAVHPGNLGRSFGSATSVGLRAGGVAGRPVPGLGPRPPGRAPRAAPAASSRRAFGTRCGGATAPP